MHISSASAHAIVKTQTSTTDESRGDDSFVRTVEFGRLGSEREREEAPLVSGHEACQEV